MCVQVLMTPTTESLSESLFGGEEIDCVVFLIRGLQALVHLWLELMERFQNQE